jgi:hypothetical protein
MAVCVSVARLALVCSALIVAIAGTPAEARGRHHHHRHHHYKHSRQISHHRVAAAPVAPQASQQGWGQATAWNNSWDQGWNAQRQDGRTNWGDPAGTWGGAAGWSHEARAENSDGAGQVVSTPTAGGGLKALVARHARANGIPVALADAVVRIESGYNPHARNRSGAMGLMQIKTQTARGQGYSGGASGLLNPETNLRYAMRYLATAFRMSGGSICGTVMRYQSGHYARHMSRADRSYCSKARRLMAQT